MNGTCAGGTGAFIDQMATLLEHRRRRPERAGAARHTPSIPSPRRCGVFAKTDVQPLLNEGAAPGGHRRVHLPGRRDPDHLGPGVRPSHPRQRRLPRRPAAVPLRAAQTLLRNARARRGAPHRRPTTPTCSWRAARAMAARASGRAGRAALRQLLERLDDLGDIAGLPRSMRLAPLFATDEDFDEFKRPPRRRSACPKRRASTATRGRVLPRHRRRLHHHQGCAHRRGRRAAAYLLRLQQGRRAGHAPSASSCADFYRSRIAGRAAPSATCHGTGYGEDAAHRGAARSTRARSRPSRTCAAPRTCCPGVEFILDIGGQDMKCLRVKDGVIDAHHAQRGLLVGLRQLHRELRRVHEHGRACVRRCRHRMPRPPSTWAAAARCL